MVIEDYLSLSISLRGESERIISLNSCLITPKYGFNQCEIKICRTLKKGESAVGYLRDFSPFEMTFQNKKDNHFVLIVRVDTTKFSCVEAVERRFAYGSPLMESLFGGISFLICSHRY